MSFARWPGSGSTSPSTRRRGRVTAALRWTAVLVACLSLTSLGAARAEPIPFGNGHPEITAREQPIAGFLQDLFGGIGVRVAISASVKGAVNGHFSGTTERVYRNIARAFNLVEYYDGSVLYVCTPQDMVTRALPADAQSSARLARAVEDMGLADERNRVRVSSTGTLVASGTRRFVEQLEEMARAQSQGQQADRVGQPSGFRVFYLRYAWAQDVAMNFGGRPVMLPGVASTVRAMMSGNSASLVSVDAAAQAPRNTVTRLREQGGPRQSTLGSAGADSRQPSAPAIAALQGGGIGATTPAGPGPDSVTTRAPGWVDPQQARVEADSRLNAVLVRDSPDRMPAYEQLISALDVEPQAVEIEATIIDVNTDRLRELGFNWRYNTSHGSLLFGKGDSSDLQLTPTTPVGDIALTGQGGIISAVLGNANQFIARINALQEQGAAKVVSSPQVLTLSNVEAVFDNSQSFYVRVAGHTDVDLFNVSAGTTLRVTPHVFKDRGEVRIKMLVSIEDGSISTRTVDNLPVVDRSSINTQAMIFENESLLVGGITRQSNSESQTKVPWLGDVPWLGALFSNRRTSAERVERMFLISPRLAATRHTPMDREGTAPRQIVAAAATASGAASVPVPVAESTPAPGPVDAPASPTLRVQDRRGPRDRYARGEAYEVEVGVERDSHLYCYVLDERRQLNQIFPNDGRKSAAVSKGSVLQFPGAFNFRLVAGRQGGQEAVACFSSDKDLGFNPLSTAQVRDRETLKLAFDRLAGPTAQAAGFDVRVR